VPRLKRVEEEAIEPLLLKVREAARMLSVSERHIDNLAAAGLLEKIHLGDAVRITRASTMKLAGMQTAAE
jgi:excisionase family DNA binding protein